MTENIARSPATLNADIGNGQSEIRFKDALTDLAQASFAIPGKVSRTPATLTEKLNVNGTISKRASRFPLDAPRYRSAGTQMAYTSSRSVPARDTPPACIRPIATKKGRTSVSSTAL